MSSTCSSFLSFFKSFVLALRLWQSPIGDRALSFINSWPELEVSWVLIPFPAVSASLSSFLNIFTLVFCSKYIFLGLPLPLLGVYTSKFDSSFTLSFSKSYLMISWTVFLTSLILSLNSGSSIWLRLTCFILNTYLCCTIASMLSSAIFMLGDGSTLISRSL